VTGTFNENVREAFVGKFLVAPIEGGTEILFSGALLITVEKDDRLPAGFHDRLVKHIMDLLTGRRTALWDDQALFGDKPNDSAMVRAMAQEVAAAAEIAREAKP
jgi:hypothetical protein